MAYTLKVVVEFEATTSQLKNPADLKRSENPLWLKIEVNLRDTDLSPDH